MTHIKLEVNGAVEFNGDVPDDAAFGFAVNRQDVAVNVAVQPAAQPKTSGTDWLAVGKQVAEKLAAAQKQQTTEHAKALRASAAEQTSGPPEAAEA